MANGDKGDDDKVVRGEKKRRGAMMISTHCIGKRKRCMKLHGRHSAHATQAQNDHHHSGYHDGLLFLSPVLLLNSNLVMTSN